MKPLSTFNNFKYFKKVQNGNQIFLQNYTHNEYGGICHVCHTVWNMTRDRISSCEGSRNVHSSLLYFFVFQLFSYFCCCLSMTHRGVILHEWVPNHNSGVLFQHSLTNAHQLCSGTLSMLTYQ